MLVAYGWGVCGLLCFDDLFVGMFDNCLMLVVMIVYVWLGLFLWFVWDDLVVVSVFNVVLLCGCLWVLRLCIVSVFNALLGAVVAGCDVLSSFAD